MSRTAFPAIVGAALLLAAPCSFNALAQSAARPRGAGMGGFVARAMLARQEAVQRELGVTAEQKAKIEALVPEDGPGGGIDPRELSEDERRKWWEGRRIRMAEADTKLASILDGKQSARLDQIRVQALGGGVMTDEEISKQIGITAEQQERFRVAMQQLRDEGQGSGAGGGMRERITAKAMEILSADQKAKLDELRGQTFDVSTLQLWRRRGQRGGN